jgi:hypothetical protein
MVAAVVVLSVATTLITLAAEHMRRARHTPAAAADLQPTTPSPATTPGPGAGHGGTLASGQRVADYDMYRPGSR